MRRPRVSLLTDYGAASEFVGTCHGVARTIAPEIDVIDLCHTITPFNIREGGFVLERALRYVDADVHVAVVDPGVGSDRRPVAVRAGNRHLVGPDNGLLTPAVKALGEPVATVVLDDEQYWLAGRTGTFDGRDIFVPVAAHLARGVALEDLGTTIDPASLQLPVPFRCEHLDDATVVAEIVRIDSFGNLTTSIDAATWQALGVPAGQRIRLVIDEQTYEATNAGTFSDRAEGELLAFIDSYEHVALAMNRARASSLLTYRAGARIVVQLGP